MRTQLQSLIFEKFGLGCNDLAEGDAGTDGRESDGLRRKGCRETGGGGKKRKSKRKRGWVYLNDWGWDPTEEFVIKRLIASPRRCRKMPPLRRIARVKACTSGRWKWLTRTTSTLL